MDESVQNQRRSEITLYSSNGVGPSVRQKHSYIHVRQLSLSALVCFLHFPETALPQMSRESPEECWPSVPQILQILGHVERLERIIACKGCSALAVWHPETGAVASKLFSMVCLCSGASTRRLICTFTLNAIWTFLSLLPFRVNSFIQMSSYIIFLPFSLKYSTKI